MMTLVGRFIAVILWCTIFCFGLVSDAFAQEQTTAQSIAPGTHSFSVIVDRLERRYLLHVPPAYDPARKWPVVVIFHGGGGTGSGVMWETGWAAKADVEGFLAVFPEGTPPDASRRARFSGNPQTWNDGSARTGLGAVKQGVADVQFVSAMVAELKTRFSADGHRVYATGFSNGASMTFRVARELPELFAAIAPVAGADWLDTPPSSPVPLLYITGTADPLNPFEGGEVRIGRKFYGLKKATAEMVELWVSVAGCPAEPATIYSKDGTTGTAYGFPGEKTAVVLYAIEGHGHHWPGGNSILPESIAGKNTAAFKATDLIWEFFKAYD
jgi:polyhydroxybutyrate depolymerase